jgi:hypothetical protein
MDERGVGGVVVVTSTRGTDKRKAAMGEREGV